MLVLASFMVAAGAIALLLLGRHATRRATGASGLVDRILHQRIYQPRALLVAVGLVAASSLFAGAPSQLQLGSAGAPARDLAWLGFTAQESWASVGVTFCVVPFLVTTIVVYLQTLRGRPWTARALGSAVLWAVPFSAANALTEELIFRLVPVQLLAGSISPGAVALFSGIAFGVPHYFGTPGKLPGVAMAGFLGWVMARSVLDTGGLGWAWLIHVVQDIPIITMMVLAAGVPTKEAERAR